MMAVITLRFLRLQSFACILIMHRWIQLVMSHRIHFYSLEKPSHKIKINENMLIISTLTVMTVTWSNFLDDEKVYRVSGLEMGRTEQANEDFLLSRDGLG